MTLRVPDFSPLPLMRFATQRPIHFVGIGGVGMSGLALILHQLGYVIQGTDQAESPVVDRLRAQGIAVQVGHQAEALQEAHLVVTSSAIGAHNAEVMAAHARGIPVIRRAELLAEMMRLRPSIAVSGTHGKTTTTSLMAAVLDQGGLSPTVINGGVMNAFLSNAHLGTGQWVVAEADESDGTLVKLPATVAVVTNMDPEHMEFFGTQEAMEDCFLRFCQAVPFYGLVVLGVDHPRVALLREKLGNKSPVVTYGFSEGAQVRAVNVRPHPYGMCFDIQVRDGSCAKDVVLALHGAHNVLNALAVVATALYLDLSLEVVRSAFASFQGVKRRFTLTGTVQGVRIVDDYAHHPVEIGAVLQAARALCGEGGKVFAVCQPHRYSRVLALIRDFQTCFGEADHVLMLPIYSAGEAPNGVTSGDLIPSACPKTHLVSGSDDVLRYLASHLKRGDMVVYLGAGDVTHLAARCPEELARIWGA